MYILENETFESSVPPGQPPGNPAQTVIDIIAVFGAMFVAAVAIILITVYIRWEDSFCCCCPLSLRYLYFLCY